MKLSTDTNIELSELDLESIIAKHFGFQNLGNLRVKFHVQYSMDNLYHVSCTVTNYFTQEKDLRR